MFKKLGLNDSIVKELKKQNITIPTNVQNHVIPLVLEDKDVVVCAKTGSGKTLAFCLPIIQKSSKKSSEFFCLILSPTRNLAKQTFDRLNNLRFSNFGLKSALIVGGDNSFKQINDLKSQPTFIVATPGRFAHIIENNETTKEFKFSLIRYVVLDEADSLMSDEFFNDMTKILATTNRKRKTLLFTATLTDPVLKLIESLKETAIANNREPAVVYQEKGDDDISNVKTVSTLEQFYIHCTKQTSYTTFMALIEKLTTENKNSSIIVFAANSKNVKTLKLLLKHFNFKADMYCKGVNEKDLKLFYERFKTQEVKIMIASNALSRGLDMDHIDYVINWDVPEDPITYIHRVGRTARAGKRGTAITFIQNRDFERFKIVMEYVNYNPDSYELGDVYDNKVVDITEEVANALIDVKLKVINPTNQTYQQEKRKKIRENLARENGNAKSKKRKLN